MSKNLMLKRDFPGPQGPRLPHLRVQRYNISAKQQNNLQLFFEKYFRKKCYTLLYIIKVIGLGVKEVKGDIAPLRS